MKLALLALVIGAFLCHGITEAKAETVMSSCACTSPVVVTSKTNGGDCAHNDLWNASSGETLDAGACVMTSGGLNLQAMVDGATPKRWMPANPTVNQIGGGVQICSTGGQPATFCFTGFSVTMNQFK